MGVVQDYINSQWAIGATVQVLDHGDVKILITKGLWYKVRVFSKSSEKILGTSYNFQGYFVYESEHLTWGGVESRIQQVSYVFNISISLREGVTVTTERNTDPHRRYVYND